MITSADNSRQAQCLIYNSMSKLFNCDIDSNLFCNML